MIQVSSEVYYDIIGVQYETEAVKDAMVDVLVENWINDVPAKDIFDKISGVMNEHFWKALE